MYMRLTPREKEMADMFEQMSKEEQEIMIEFAKRLRTEDPKELVKEINQRLHLPVSRISETKDEYARRLLESIVVFDTEERRNAV